jgi:hypothetical protein
MRRGGHCARVFWDFTLLRDPRGDTNLSLKLHLERIGEVGNLSVKVALKQIVFTQNHESWHVDGLPSMFERQANRAPRGLIALRDTQRRRAARTL